MGKVPRVVLVVRIKRNGCSPELLSLSVGSLNHFGACIEIYFHTTVGSLAFLSGVVGNGVAFAKTINSLDLVSGSTLCQAVVVNSLCTLLRKLTVLLLALSLVAVLPTNIVSVTDDGHVHILVLVENCGGKLVECFLGLCAESGFASTEEDTRIESNANILHAIIGSEHFSLGSSNLFGGSLSLVHAVANQHTGTGTYSCSDGSTNGSTFALTSQLTDQCTEGTTTGTTDKTTLGCVAHRTSAQQERSTQKERRKLHFVHFF